MDMELRDRIAIEAMKINFARLVNLGEMMNEEEMLEFVSDTSYKIADAMLRKREEQNGQPTTGLDSGVPPSPLSTN